MFYFDLGVNWNISHKTQLYTKIDNVTNIRPPDIGQQDNNQVLYDVIGRMFRVGVRFSTTDRTDDQEQGPPETEGPFSLVGVKGQPTEAAPGGWPPQAGAIVRPQML